MPHCTLREATFDTEPVALDFQLPHDGQMHTMSFDIEERGGMIIAIKAPGPGTGAEATPLRILQMWCEAGHPAPTPQAKEFMRGAQEVQPTSRRSFRRRRR